MRLNGGHIAFVSFLSFTTLAMRPQQPARNINEIPANGAEQGPASVMVGADAVRACPKEFFKSLPEGVYPMGPGVSAPVPRYTPRAALSDEARKYMKEHQVANFEAISIIGLTVEVDGTSRDTCVIKRAGYGLDKTALKVVAKYRFEPATLDGNPVPVRIAVEVRFVAD